MRRYLPALLLVVLPLCGGCVGFSIHARGGTSTSPDRHEQHRASVAPDYLGVPRGHLPPPGACRAWRPGVPPGHQPAPGHCEDVYHDLGPGDWLLHRPWRDEEVIEVTVYDARAGGVVWVFDARSGRYLHGG